MSIQHFASADTFGIQTLSVGRSVAIRLAWVAAVPFALLARQVKINRTTRQLLTLDDRTLADIGLRRTQILSTAAQVIDWPHVDPRRLAK